MTLDRKRQTTMAVLAAAAIALAVASMLYLSSRPQETITDYDRVPPKGAGRADR